MRLVQQYVKRPRPNAERPRALKSLTERELAVLSSIARGHSNAQVVAELFLSETTVKSHVTHIFSKLRLHDRAQAVVVAYESGLVEPGESTST